jgi:hypothetical protein
MSLSLSPVEVWDFQAASNPLVGQVLGATLTAQNGASANTSSGLVITDASASRARLASVPSGLQIARPISIVMGLRFSDVNAAQFSSGIVGYGEIGVVQGLGISGQPTIANSDSAQINLRPPNITGAGDGSPTVIANTTDYVLVGEYTTTTRRLRVNGSLLVDISGTFTGAIPTDFNVGKSTNVAVAFSVPFCAVFDGILTADDIAALGSTFASARDALFAPAAPSGPSPAAIQYYRRLNGLTP